MTHPHPSQPNTSRYRKVGLFIDIFGVAGSNEMQQDALAKHLKLPDHCDRAGSSPAPGTNNNTLKPKVPANIISKDI